MTNNCFDLIIVGCGPAGIGAAIEFQKLQPTARFLILEARNRVGGRAFTDSHTFGVNVPVDWGARWLCHHQPDNLLRAYYTPSDRDWVESDVYGVSRMIIFDEDGTSISEDSIEQAKKIVERFFSNVKQYPREKADVSILDVIHDEYTQMKNEQMRRLVSMWLGFTENHEASDLAELSVKSYTVGEGNLDECDLALADGLGSFIQQIAERHNLPIELNAVVTHIDTSTQCKGFVHVSTQDDRSYLCKYVLVTVPLGCLKARSIVFTPPLPECKLTAIDQMGFGLLNKVYLQFPSLFWDKTLQRISVASNRFKFYFCMPSARILSLHIAGSVARELEQQSDEQIVEQVVDSLRRLYPLMPHPIKWLITRWGSDPFSRGSYSTFHVGTDLDILTVLARESHDGRVHWAGEHTNYDGSIGYVDSGFESGQREAINISNKLQQSTESIKD